MELSNVSFVHYFYKIIFVSDSSLLLLFRGKAKRGMLGMMITVVNERFVVVYF